MRQNRIRALLGGGRRGEFRVRAATTGGEGGGPATGQSVTNELWLYDVIDPSADDYWGGISASMVVAALQSFGNGPVLIHVNSPGGDVFEGLAMYSTIRQHAGDVTVRVEGLAASSASFVALAGNRVEIEPNAMMMIHDAWTYGIGNAAELHKQASVLDQTSANMASMYQSHSGQGDVASWRALMIEETWYAGQEAVDAGLAHAVTSAPGQSGDAGGAVAARWDLSVFANAPRPGATPEPPLPAAVETPPADVPEPTQKPFEFNFAEFRKAMMEARR